MSALESVVVGKEYKMKDDCSTGYHYFKPGSTVRAVSERMDKSALCEGVDKFTGALLSQRISFMDLEEIPKG